MTKLKSICLAAFILFCCFGKAQLAGTYSVPATFSTLAAAISSLNTAGVSSTVTILIDANYTETAPVGGYSLTATGTSVNPIIFQKNGPGANPLITAYAGGAGTPGSAAQDGVWRLIGSDYITIDGIDINDPNAANPATMEFGYGLFRASASDGCQNNTIKNCVITLNRINNASGTTPAVDGSRGIDLVNATSNAHTTPLAITTASGSNSYNKFYSNTIQNCNIGISLIGYADVTPFTFADFNNDVGGASAVTGNTIINFGGAAAATNPAAGVRTLAQYSLNVSYNTINNNNGGGVSHVTTLRGIFINTATSANLTVSNNTITVKSGATTSNLTAIENIAGSTAAGNAVNITGNLITGCGYPGATSGVFTGILNSSSCASVNIVSNTFSNNSTSATSGTQPLIQNTGGVTSAINISNNSVTSHTFTAAFAGTFNFITNSGGTAATLLSILSNSLQGLNHGVAGTAAHSYLINSSATGTQNISSNNFINLNVNISGSVIFISNNVSLGATGTQTINGNAIVTGYNKTGAGGTVQLYFSNAVSPAGAVETQMNNNFSNITLTGATTMSGWANTDGGSPTKIFSANTFTNWTCGTSAVTGINLNFNGLNSAITNNTIQTVTGTGAITGIIINSSGSGVNTYSGNVIGGFSSITTGGAVIGMSGGSASVPTLNINSNTISALSTVGAVAATGINLTSALNVNVFKNKIYDLQSNNASGTVNGLLFSSGTVNAYNNLIGDLRTPSANAANPLNGINITGGTTMNIYYNTVRLAATSTGAAFGSSAIFASSTPNVNLRNNIFINNSTPIGTGSVVAYRRSSTTLTSYSATSNNNLYYAGTPGANNLIFTDGTNMMQTLSTYTAFVAPRDANSKTENTTFLSVVGTSPNFLHVDPTSGSVAESAAANIAGITDDFDADIRQGNVGYLGSGTAPDIGADEFNSVLPNCNSVVGGTATPAPINSCSGQSVSVNVSGFTTGAGIVYQWQVSNTPGGPYSNVVGGIGANSTSYGTPTLATGSYYYVLLTTCTISANSAISTEATVNINPIPSVSVSPNSSTICLPGGSSVAVTASGATSYSWLPAAGLSGTVGVSVNAFPASTTVYTLTGNALGCIGTTTFTVNVGNSPNVGGISATPTLVCGGGNSSLQAAGSLTSYVVSSIAYSPVPTPTTGVITLCNAGVQVTPLSAGSLDDGSWNGLGIPFNFNFFGTSYNTFAVSTNGFIFLGAGAPNNYSGYGTAFPSTTPGRPAIGAVYSDLYWTNMGTVQTFTTGTAPNRQLVVNFTGGQFFSNTGSITAQAVLYETSNVLEVHIFTSTGNNAAVEGIQNAAGTAAYVVAGRNAVTWPVAAPDAYRWTPVAPVYSWLPTTYLNNPNIANPIANTVTSSIVYTVTMTSPLGCSSNTSIALAADITPTVTISGTNQVCSGNSVSLTASGAVNYTWSNGPQTPGISDTPTTTTTYSVIGTSSAGCTGTAFQTVTVNITPTVSIAGNNTVCAGQPVALTANGANSYSWSNGGITQSIAPTPTANTTYSVIGTTTAGCSSNAALTVTMVALPSVSITPAPGAICPGQTASLIASGGGVDTYSWSNGAVTAVTAVSPAVTTNYSILVGSNVTGCTNSAAITITVNPEPTIVISGPTVSCAGSTLSLNASGANTYLWSNGNTNATIVVSPTTSTSYSVLGTAANGCTASASQFVQVNPLPVITVSANPIMVCQGNSVALIATGANTYSWSNGALTASIAVSPTANTVYSVIGTSTAGCTGTVSQAITVNPKPTLVVVASSATICENGTVNITAGGANSYSWSTGSTAGSISDSPTVTTTYTVTGTNTVTGCSDTQTITIVVTPCTVTGLQGLFNGHALLLYPNPNSGEFTIELANGAEKNWEITDVSGRLILSGNSADDKIRINMNEYAKGVYYVKVKSESASKVIRIITD